MRISLAEAFKIFGAIAGGAVAAWGIAHSYLSDIEATAQDARDRALVTATQTDDHSSLFAHPKAARAIQDNALEIVRTKTRQETLIEGQKEIAESIEDVEGLIRDLIRRQQMRDK